MVLTSQAPPRRSHDHLLSTPADWVAKATLAAMVLLLGLPIAMGLAVWLKRTGGADITLHP
jgi:hypothetical protein